jgi:pimeloyl-ACP methyl ester carboxylesterase
LQDVDSVLLPSTDWGHFGPLEQPREVVQAIVDRLLGESDSEQGLMEEVED